MPLVMEKIRETADRAAVRMELGGFVMRGPGNNIMELESETAWLTVAGQLHHEGYQMVPPEEYAESYHLSVDQVTERIETDGTLFALFYESHDETRVLVPLDERKLPE